MRDDRTSVVAIATHVHHHSNHHHLVHSTLSTISTPASVSSNRGAMLKVVGASWEQTRASTYILLAFFVFGLFIIIYGGTVTQFEEDGNFAATVYWKKDVGYRIEFWGQGNLLADLPIGSARGYYRQDIANIGWSKIELETNPEFPDYVQAYSAGLLEGSLSWQMIHWRWKNTIESVCDSNKKDEADACDDIRKRLILWAERMNTKAADLAHLEPFWHQVHLFFCQLDGLATGWRYGVKRARYHHEIQDEDFLWINLLATDVPLPDVPNLRPKAPSLSNSLIKIRKVNNTSEILAAHTTANTYRDMLKIAKKYIFHFHLTSTENSGFVPGTVLEFTGYPGALSSQDDVYSISSKYFYRHSLLVIGSSVGLGGAGLREPPFKLRRRRNIEERVAGSIRGLTACRLARDGRTWAAHFNRGRGGASADKQWQIVDISKVRNEESDGLLWIVEQSQGVIYASDKTDTLRENTYWACFGFPYHKEMRIGMNLPFDLDQLEEESIREKAFKICKEHCHVEEEVFHLIRSSVPPMENFVGGRGDLYSKDPTAFGIVDTKIITASGLSNFTWTITAGPIFTLNATAGEEPFEGCVSPFQWSTSEFFPTIHIGQPDIWSYISTMPNWAY